MVKIAQLDEDHYLSSCVASARFVWDNLVQFQSRYPNQHVALSGTQVVSTGATYEEVCEKLEAGGIERSRVHIWRIAAKAEACDVAKTES